MALVVAENDAGRTQSSETAADVEVDELAALKAKLTTLRTRDREHQTSLAQSWQQHWEQDAWYRDAEARQAAMDEWSQRVIEETMAVQSGKIQRELSIEADEASARLRLPPVPDHERRLDDERLSEKRLRIREAEEKRRQLAITAGPPPPASP